MSVRRVARSARVRPNKVRDREIEEVREKDPDGRIVVHRTVDTLGKMLKAGTISQAMYDAAKDLQAAFHRREPRPDPGAADPARAG